MVQITSVEFSKQEKTVTITARDIDREDWFAQLLGDEQDEVMEVVKTKVYKLTDPKDRVKFSTMLDYYTVAEENVLPLAQMKQLEGKKVNFLA